MGMTLLSELEYINSLEKADTDDNFEQFEPVLTRAEEALIKAKKSELTPADRRDNFHLNRERPVDNAYTVAGMSGAMADMTPLVGEIKAISELPNDLAYARELVKSGYDENDLRQMGLGGAYSVLSVMGIVPGIRVGAKVAKKSFKEIMDEELAKDVKPEPPKVDTPPKEILPSETTEEFLQKREKSSSQETAKRQYGLMSKR
jgi:hypothetical protein